MDKLRILAVSGTTGVTENLYVYEYTSQGRCEMIVVDCGVGFPEPEMYGVDLVIPDFTYLEKNRDKLKAILITHGHEDHFGALPFLPKGINVPIYSTKLVSGFIRDKMKDYGIKDFDLRIFDPVKDTLSIGVFKITPFLISHSVPDSVGYVIDTPEGKIFHVADYKFDWTPVDGRPFDVRKVAMLASEGSLALISDCLGSTSPGYTESELRIEGKIMSIASGVKGVIFFTTISSNISRMKQALNVAAELGRKVCFIGRSIISKTDCAKALGYLEYPDDLVVNPKTASDLPKDKVMYIISGSYGQPGSALYRTALGDHEFLSIEPGDVVIFSSDPAPPGSKTNIDFLVDKLFEADINVHYYDMQEDLHVSGHGSQEDIKMLMALTKPKYLIPVGGTIRHMRAFTHIAVSMGHKTEDVFEMSSGDSVEFSQGRARKGKKEEVKNVLVDGLGIGDVGNVVLRDRQLLAKEGVAIAIIQYDSSKKEIVAPPEIVSRGFVFVAKTKDLLNEASAHLVKELGSNRNIERQVIKNTASNVLEKFFYSKTGRRPMVLPVIVEV